MDSIAFRNSSRRLLRAYFSKLGWQANVIWRIAFFNQLQVYPSWLWRSDLFRASLKKQEQFFLDAEGTKYTQQNNVPLWVGEFGSVFNGPADEAGDRLRALDDQLSIF